MFWIVKALIVSVREGLNYFKEHLYLQIMIHRHEAELERRKVLKR